MLESFLGFTTQHRAFVFGVGRLGAALMRDSGLNQYGLDIVAGFDVRKQIIGKEIDGISIFHLNQLPEIQRQFDATIGIIAVPVENAQEVTDFIINHGIRALWNFTPFRIIVPNHIVVQNTSIYANLAVMFNRMR
jgi:redox-sensing transcriptional repressor